MYNLELESPQIKTLQKTFSEGFLIPKLVFNSWNLELGIWNLNCKALISNIHYTIYIFKVR